jgi:hypothetical protein
MGEGAPGGRGEDGAATRSDALHVIILVSFFLFTFFIIKVSSLYFVSVLSFARGVPSQYRPVCQVSAWSVACPSNASFLPSRRPLAEPPHPHSFLPLCTSGVQISGHQSGCMGGCFFCWSKLTIYILGTAGRETSSLAAAMDSSNVFWTATFAKAGIDRFSVSDVFFFEFERASTPGGEAQSWHR